MRYTEYHSDKAVIKNKALLPEAMERLARMEDLMSEGRLFALPVVIGSKVYEVIVDERFEPYIEEYEVQDVSVKAVKYADKWVENDEGYYTSRELAEYVLEIVKGGEYER